MQSRPSANTSLTVDDFSKYIQNKRDLYEACQRNGFYLPKQKTSMVTEEYMRQIIQGNSWCPLYKKLVLLPCPRPPSKAVLLEKFWAYADNNRLLILGVDREKHNPDKRWLLDVLSTYTPSDEIFAKGYCPPERASKLSEIRSIEIPVDFMKDLPLSRRKSRRKGLRLQKEGLRQQKKERFRMMQKKYAHAILDEEVKDDTRRSKSRSQAARSATNEGAFKSPRAPVTPTKPTSASKDTLNTSASSIG